MLLMYALLAMVTAAGAVVLLVRLWSARRTVRQAFGSLAGDPLARQLITVVDRAMDSGLLAGAGAGHLEEVEVQFREHRTPYRTVMELVRQMASLARATSFSELTRLIEMLYQIQITFGLPSTAIDSPLSMMIDRLGKTDSSSSTVGRVEKITAGVLLDPSRMTYLTSGTHVSQPLGVIVYDRQGAVLRKARVLCR